MIEVVGVLHVGLRAALAVDLELVEHFAHEFVRFDVVAGAAWSDAVVVVERDDVVTIITQQRFALLALHRATHHVHAQRTFHFGNYAFVTRLVLDLRLVDAENGL